MNTRKRRFHPLIGELRQSLARLYGARLKKIVLFGSHARGQATKESDVDLLIVLDRLESLPRELDRIIPLIAELNLKHGILASCLPLDVHEYDKANTPLLMNVHREGIVVHEITGVTA